MSSDQLSISKEFEAEELSAQQAQEQIDLLGQSSSVAVDGQSDTIRGVIERVTYRNPENNYAVVQLSLQGSPQTVTVVGRLPFPVGSHLMVKGTYKAHHKFGMQLEVTAVNEIEPGTAEGIEKYLSSGFVTGVGPKTAARLVKAFGDQTLEILLHQPEQATRVQGLSKKAIERIRSALLERRERMDAERFFSEHNLAPGLIDKLIQKYGEQAISTVKKDPYNLAYEMRGVGFATADRVALELGFAPDSPARIRAGLFYALQKAQDDGHCFLDLQQLFEKTTYLLGLEEGPDYNEHLSSLASSQFVVVDDQRAYLKALYEAEVYVANFVAQRLGPHSQLSISSEQAENCLRQAETELGITFSAEQRRAVQLATQHPLLLVTGGPGCGKTTVIRALAALFNLSGKILMLAAPTGKAAQRMSQVTGLTARTIHRLLKFDPMSGDFIYNSDNPIKSEEHNEQEIDAVIIDETSMLDINLARDLFAALPTGATIILVGDKDQLPSVGPGRVFADLVQLKEVTTVSLNQLFRRSEESRITSIAHAVNAGVVADIPEPDGITRSDAYFIPRRDPEEAARLIESLIAEQIPNKFGIPLDDITVLTPSNRGALGVLELNKRIQARINPENPDSPGLSYFQNEYRLGDRICQRVNNYKIDLFGVFNGDIGKVHAIDLANRSMVAEIWDGRLIQYSDKDLKQISLSYAMTVHRSQGSEMPCVVLALDESHYTLLERQLLYTAITRAKKLLIIVGSKRALSIACKRASGSKRKTALSERILHKIK